MSDANKKVVLDYLQALADGRRADARAAIGDDCIYRPPPSMSHGEFHGPAEIFDLYFDVDRQLFDTGVDSYEWKIVSAVAEGEVVVVEISHKSRTITGKPYATDYLVLYGVRDGQIRYIREYFDSLYIKDIVADTQAKFPQAPHKG